MEPNKIPTDNQTTVVSHTTSEYVSFIFTFHSRDYATWVSRNVKLQSPPLFRGNDPLTEFSAYPLTQNLILCHICHTPLGTVTGQYSPLSLFDSSRSSLRWRETGLLLKASGSATFAAKIWPRNLRSFVLTALLISVVEVLYTPIQTDSGSPLLPESTHPTTSIFCCYQRSMAHSWK